MRRFGTFGKLYFGYIGIMENKMETTIMGYIGIICPFIHPCMHEIHFQWNQVPIGVVLGLYWGVYRENGR